MVQDNIFIFHVTRENGRFFGEYTFLKEKISEKRFISCTLAVSKLAISKLGLREGGDLQVGGLGSGAPGAGARESSVGDRFRPVPPDSTTVGTRTNLSESTAGALRTSDRRRSLNDREHARG